MNIRNRHASGLTSLRMQLGIAGAVIYARNADIQPNGQCHIGVKRAVVIPGTVADVVFHVYLTCVFVYFL
jgi:hypothetical protein